MRTHEGFEWLYVLSGKPEGHDVTEERDIHDCASACPVSSPNTAGTPTRRDDEDQVGLTASSRWQAAWGGAGVTMGK
jgi:hypothetical protein